MYETASNLFDFEIISQNRFGGLTPTFTVTPLGLEPRTQRLRVFCSTN